MRSSALVPIVFFPLWWCALAFLLAQAAFAVHLPLFPALWLGAWIGALLVTRLTGATGRDAGIAGAVSAVAWAVLCGLAMLVRDYSWDGQAYHQEAVLILADGWNPCYTELTREQTRYAPFLNGYPKASWLLETMIFQIWGRMEATKVAMWLPGLAVAGMGALWTARLSGPRIARWALFALWCLSPINICQWATFQVDGFMNACLVGVLLCSLGLVWPERAPWSRTLSWLGLGAWLALLAAMKFTGLVFSVYALLCLGGVLFYQQRRRLLPLPKRVWTVLPVLLVVSALVVAQPYAQNCWRYGHPFWPVMGKNTEDVTSYQEHPGFLKHNLLVKFIWANNAQARHLPGFMVPEDADRYGAPRWKLPFTLYREELKSYIAPDVHIGGFGPWYGPLLGVALVLLIIGLWKGWPGARGVALLWAMVFVSVMLISTNWWARYVPQGWWLALLPLYPALSAGKGARRSVTLLTVLLAVNVVLVLLVNTAGQAICELGTYRQLRLLAEHKDDWKLVWGLAPSNRQRFKEAGIDLTGRVAPAPPEGWIGVKLIRTDTQIYTRDAELARALEAALLVKQR